MKKNILKYFFTWVSLWLLIGSSTAAGNKIEFQRYSVKEGLPHSIVRCMLQDQSGFLWFGTGNGLVRYDGYTFKLFQSEVNGPLDNDNINGLLEDAQGNIWISSGVTLKNTTLFWA